jgi:hypothetical protein
MANALYVIDLRGASFPKKREAIQKIVADNFAKGHAYVMDSELASPWAFQGTVNVGNNEDEYIFQLDGRENIHTLPLEGLEQLMYQPEIHMTFSED